MSIIAKNNEKIKGKVWNGKMKAWVSPTEEELEIKPSKKTIIGEKENLTGANFWKKQAKLKSDRDKAKKKSKGKEKLKL